MLKRARWFGLVGVLVLVTAACDWSMLGFGAGARIRSAERIGGTARLRAAFPGDVGQPWSRGSQGHEGGVR